MTDDNIYDRLCALLPAQFDSVLLRAGIPLQFVSPAAAPQATRAAEVVAWMRQAPDHDTRLRRALATVARTAEPDPAPAPRPATAAPAPTPPARTILFMAAEPTDAARIRVGREFEEIRDRLRVPIAQGRLALDSRFALRPRDLSRVLHDTDPSIVHFSGHGSQDHRLVLEADDGTRTGVDPGALEALFSYFPRIDAVVLNACWSDEQAEALAHAVPHVVGMRDAITDKAAIAFSCGLYGALAAGRSFAEAFELGCIELRLLQIPEHLTPVLITRDPHRPPRDQQPAASAPVGVGGDAVKPPARWRALVPAGAAVAALALALGRWGGLPWPTSPTPSPTATLLLPSPTPSQAAPKQRSIVVVAIDDRTDEPLSGAQVLLDEQGLSKETDSTGRCELALRPGLERVRLTVRMRGYETQSRDITVFEGMDPQRMRLKALGSPP